MIRLFFYACLLTSISGFSQPITQGRPLTGRTTGSLPYLEYGLGGDRLGGAKMTYLDTGIVVKIIDSTIGNYKIQLSKEHSAYLPKSNFKKDNSIKNQSYYLTNSWLVSGDSVYDYVMVSLDEKLPYKSMQQIGPSRIVVDVYGATSNTNWITQRISAREIKNVYYEQIEDDVFRIIIELKHAQHWGYSIYYRDKRLVIKVKRQPGELSLENMKIAVDAGHGGDNPGTSGVTTGISEKKYTLLIAKQLEVALRKKEAKIFMTRETDITIGMRERIEMIKKEDPDFLISIHLNGSVKDTVAGVSTYYRYIGFKPLTQYIQESMLKLGLKDFGNIGSFNFELNGPTDYPNCLVEVAFLSNREDEQRVLDPEFHKEVANQIVEGIKEWLKACKKNDN